MENLDNLYKLVMDAKALAHLEKGRKRVTMTVNADMKEDVRFDTDAVILNELTHMLSKHLATDVKNYMKVEKGFFAEEEVHSVDLIVFPTEVFRNIIEVIVKNMSSSQIERIRGNEESAMLKSLFKLETELTSMFDSDSRIAPAILEEVRKLKKEYNESNRAS